MKLTLKKELEDGNIRTLMTIDAEDMDEFIISSFQDELDMEIYFFDMSKGRFTLISEEKGKEVQHKVFYRCDYESFKNKFEIGNYDNKEFIDYLKKNCPNITKNIDFTDNTEGIRGMMDVFNDKTIIRNFRNIYKSVEEYSIERIENARNKVLKK